MWSKLPAIHSDPDILGGTPVFVGTRVPVKMLLDYPEAGQPLEEFLDDLPSVSRQQAIAAVAVPSPELRRGFGLKSMPEFAT